MVQTNSKSLKIQLANHCDQTIDYNLLEFVKLNNFTAKVFAVSWQKNEMLKPGCSSSEYLPNLIV